LTEAYGRECLKMMTSMIMVAGAEELVLGWWSNTLVGTDSVVRRKWKWPFVNGWKCGSLVSTMTKILNSCQGGIYASICSGIVLKNIVEFL
jgi:hypothetical protein